MMLRSRRSAVELGVPADKQITPQTNARAFASKRHHFGLAPQKQGYANAQAAVTSFPFPAALDRQMRVWRR